MSHRILPRADLGTRQRFGEGQAWNFRQELRLEDLLRKGEAGG
jgi:hypothetical protein